MKRKDWIKSKKYNLEIINPKHKLNQINAYWTIWIKK